MLPQIALFDPGTPALADIVLVAVTGWGAESDRERTREAGFDHHLLKPASMDQVQAIVGAAEASIRRGNPAT